MSRNCVLTLCCCAALLAACRDEPAAPPKFPVEWLGRFYQAGALWEMDRHAEAARRYEAMLAPSGRDPAVLANLASCLIAKQKLERAEALAREAAAAAPASTAVQLVLAGALEARMQRDESLELLRHLAAAAPGHVVAHHALISALHNDGTEQHLDDIAGQYALLLSSAPRNLAALLDAARVQAMRGDLAAAAALFERAMAVAADPPDRLRPFLEQFDAAVASGESDAVLRVINIARNLLRSTDRFRMDILLLGPVGDKLPRLVQHPLRPLSGPGRAALHTRLAFEDATAAWGLDGVAADHDVRRIVVGTALEDRSPALFAVREQGAGRLLLRRAGRYVDVTDEAGLGHAEPSRNACFVDLNNDYHMDLVLAGRTADQLFLNRGGGRFEDATAGSGLEHFGPSQGAVPFDFDHDGDLDLLRWDAERLALQGNDGEGRLGPVLNRPGLPAEVSGIAAIVPRDLDDDGDIDLCVLCGAGPYALRVFSNERLGTFREVTSELGSLAAPFEATPIFEDFDGDGLLEVLDAGRLRRWQVAPGFVVSDSPFTRTADPTPAAHAAAGDFDCDGVLDVLEVRNDGATNLPGVRLTAAAAPVVLDLDGDGLLDVLSAGGPAYRNTSSAAGHWLAVGLKGLISGDSRFNAFGLGSTLEIRAGDHYQKRHVTSATTHFGLGPCAHADVLRVVWPNGNYQNLEFRAADRLELAANQLVVEEQTLKGSCPYLYAWNGERFEFVTDVLWRSALGMSVGGGIYGHHGTADDSFKIAGEQLRPRGDFYVLQFTEELWEVAYFDYARLLVVDHPGDTDVFVDEKCIAPPYPPFEIFGVREARAVRAAHDGRGRDVAGLLERRDGRFAAGFEPTRYQGIVQDHELVLDLGPFPDDAAVRLFLQGWLWPTDASTNVAVAQNPRVQARPPRLEVPGADGRWQASAVVVGFPSGKNKTIVLDLGGRFPTADHRVRLSTNFAIYWDRAFLTVGPQHVELRVTELAVASADLHTRGFSREFARVPHGPTIPAYGQLDPGRQWRDMVGYYTRYGDVGELLTAADSRYVIVGAGDEVTLRFDASAAPALPPGWRRDFVVHTDGWLKDGDLNTAAGGTVEPLPFHGMSRYPYPPHEAYPSDPLHSAYLREYNTRYRDSGQFRDFLLGSERH